MRGTDGTFEGRLAQIVCEVGVARVSSNHHTACANPFCKMRFHLIACSPLEHGNLRVHAFTDANTLQEAIHSLWKEHGHDVFAMARTEGVVDEEDETIEAFTALLQRPAEPDGGTMAWHVVEHTPFLDSVLALFAW